MFHTFCPLGLHFSPEGDEADVLDEAEAAVRPLEHLHGTTTRLKKEINLTQEIRRELDLESEGREEA